MIYKMKYSYLNLLKIVLILAIQLHQSKIAFYTLENEFQI